MRCGSAAGVDGPRIFLAKGQRLDYDTFKAFTKHHKAPAGSCVEMTPNAYMTNDAWRKIVPKLCEGIRQMKGICDHPNWWVVLSLDGFGSHLDPEALLVFSKYKILIVKEEGDTSQVSQAYDQQTAKEDKRWTREMLDGYKFHISAIITQWELILIINEALNNVAEGNSWIISFTRVNMKPSKRIPFKQWIKK